jgi:predicted nucleotidyltransferase
MAVSIEETLAHLRRRTAERRARGEARARAIRALLPEAKRLLVERHGARRVVLFGSLARDEMTERSDIDLATEGLRPTAFFTAIADLTGLLDSPVDLVEIETAPASLRARLAAEGIEL